MNEPFEFDVFISHCSRDKPIVRPLADKLRSDGVRVWLDEWQIKPGDNILLKVEEGLAHSRALVLCISANALGSDWAQLEAGTFRFRDVLNKKRHFIPLRLDNAPIDNSLAQFLYVDWAPDVREREYPRLLEACRPPAQQQSIDLCIKNATINAKKGEVRIGGYSPVVSLATFESGRWNG